MFLIASFEHSNGPIVAWWKPNSNGYTTDMNEAGRYSEEEARAIVDGAEPGNEAMILEDRASDISKVTVDVEALRDVLGEWRK